jgi:hypothetical protein
MFTRALHWSLSWSRSIQFIPPHPISQRSILILPTYPRFGLPNGLFPSGFPPNILYAVFSPKCYMPCPSRPPWLGYSDYIWRKYNLWSFSLCSFLQPPVTSALFGPNILLSTLFSNILNLCSFLNVRDQVSHPYRTTDKIIVLSELLGFGLCPTSGILKTRKHNVSETGSVSVFRWMGRHLLCLVP